MRYIQSILELWCLLFICFAWGRRILDLGPCWIKRQLGLYLAPGLGLASILWFVSLFGRFMPMRSIYSFSFTLPIVIFSLLKEHRQREFWQQSKWLGLFAVIGSLPVFAPEIRYGGYSPFTDIFTYLAQSQWLQAHAFSEKILTTAYHPAWSQIALYQSTGARMGGTFFLSYVQSLFHLTWSYDAYLPTVALGVISGCLFLGAIIRQVVPLKHRVTLVLSLMPAVLSNGFIYGAEWGFFPQTYGLAFAFGLAALLPLLLRQVLAADLTWKAYFLYALPTSLCGAAMLLAYNEPFPLFFGGMGLFMLLNIAMHVKRRKALCLISGILILELAILMNTELVRLVHNIYQTLTISHGHLSIGWPVLWHPARFIAFSFGMASYFNQPAWLEYLMNWVITPIGLVALFYLLARFMQQHPKRHLTLGLLFCFEFVLWCFFIKFRYFSVGDASEMGQTFLQFKISKYASPFSVSLLAIGCGIAWFYFKKARLYLRVFFVLVIATGLYYHVSVVPKYFTNHFLNSVKQRHAPFDVLLKLRQTMQTIPPQDVIELAFESEHMKLRQFLTYILWDKRLVGHFQDDDYLRGQLSPDTPTDQAQWALFMNGAIIDKKEKLSSPPFNLQKKPFLFITLKEQQGGYPTEINPNGQTFNWVKHAMDMKFCIEGDVNKAAFSCRFRPINDKAKTLRAQLKTTSGHILATYNIPNVQKEFDFDSGWFKIEQAKCFILHVESDGEPTVLSHRDQRLASFMVTNLSWRLSKASTENKSSNVTN